MPGDRDTSFDALIPELPHWNNGRGIDVDAWIGCIGRHDHAIGYSRVFWPDFVLHEGHLLRAGFDVDSYRGFAATGRGRQAVEAVMNHEHLVDIFMGFANEGIDPTREQILYLGRMLEEMWTAKLQRDFPDLDLVVSFPREHEDDLTRYEITVFQAE
jgi:hypothetical protein